MDDKDDDRTGHMPISGDSQSSANNSRRPLFARVNPVVLLWSDVVLPVIVAAVAPSLASHLNIRL